MKSKLEIRTEVLRILGDSTNKIWASTEIDRYVAAGYDRFCLDTEILWRRHTIGDVVDVPTYDLPLECYNVERVEWNNYRINPQRPLDITEPYPAFESIQGSMRAYTMQGDGLRVIRRIPRPAVTDATMFIIEYTRRGATLSTPEVRVEVPDRYAMAPRFFALERALGRDGDGQNLKLAAHFKLRYDALVIRANQRKSRARSLRTGVLGGSNRRGFGPPPRPQLPWNYSPLK